MMNLHNELHFIYFLLKIGLVCLLRYSLATKVAVSQKNTCTLPSSSIPAWLKHRLNSWLLKMAIDNSWLDQPEFLSLKSVPGSWLDWTDIFCNLRQNHSVIQLETKHNYWKYFKGIQNYRFDFMELINLVQNEPIIRTKINWKKEITFKQPCYLRLTPALTHPKTQHPPCPSQIKFGECASWKMSPTAMVEILPLRGSLQKRAFG